METLRLEYKLVTPGAMKVGGVEFDVIETTDVFDLGIPAINVYMMHMLGLNTYNILASIEQIDGMITQVEDFQAEGYGLVLTRHEIPRDIEIAVEGVDSLTRTKELAGSYATAMQAAFPEYYGADYLEMSTGALFYGGQAGNGGAET